jgi:23S rRNA (uracil1939-C5)-methyltransferase
LIYRNFSMSNRNGKNGSSSKGGSSLWGKKPRPKKNASDKKGGSVYVRDDAPRMSAARTAEKILPQTNKRLGEFTIERWSHDGRGLTTLNGKTLFVAGALPGEKITARLMEEHSRFIEARADEILEPASERQQPPCPHFSLCGGCQLQHIEPATQLAMKQQSLLQQLQNWGGVTPKRILPAVSSSASQYRSRARLGVWYEADGSISLGFRQQQSKAITPINECLVLVPELNALIEPVRQFLAGLRQSKAITHVELVSGKNSRSIILRHIKALSAIDIAALTQLANGLASDHSSCHIWLEPNGKIGLTELDGTACDPRLIYEVSGLELAFHPQDFTQVNPQINQQMVAQALELLALDPSHRVLDLFCGIGNFTLPIAHHCAEVIGIEAVESMVARGRENAARLDIGNATFIAANLANMTHTQLQRLAGSDGQGVDAILLDPPRDGAKDIIASLQQWIATKQLSPKRIVYVSCNPATLARDAALLAEAGYSLEAVGVLDMFPHTSHVESMALFLPK